MPRVDYLLNVTAPEAATSQSVHWLQNPARAQHVSQVCGCPTLLPSHPLVLSALVPARLCYSTTHAGARGVRGRCDADARSAAGADAAPSHCQQHNQLEQQGGLRTGTAGALGLCLCESVAGGQR